MKLHITEKAIREVAVPAGRQQVMLFDQEQTGFAVCVTKTGFRSYVIVYRDALGKQRQEKLANFDTITASAARAVAKARLDAIQATKSQYSRRRASCPTMDAFFFDTFLPLLRSQIRSHEAHASIYRNHLQKTFGSMRLDDITEQDVLAFNSKLINKPVAFKNLQHRKLADGTVKRILILLRHILNEALRHQGITLKRNPTHALRLKTIRKVKGKFLTRDQLQRLMRAAEKSLNADLPDIIRVMGTTGLRRNNVLAMRWDWFDASRGTLSIPADKDKAKKGFILHISSDVQALLAARQARSDSEWVFPNPKTGAPYQSCRAAWLTARARAGLADLRMHDMRHTFASMMLDSGADIVDVQHALAHTQLKTTAIYLHLTESRKRFHANAASQATGLFA